MVWLALVPHFAPADPVARDVSLTAYILETSHLVKRFGGLTATDGVTLQLNRGETMALIGPNGAGKSTLIAQLSGALSPDSGTIHFNGTDVTGLSCHQRAALGMTRSFQVTSIFSSQTAQENVVLAVLARSGSPFRFWRPVASERHLIDEALHFLEIAGLGERSDVIAGQLAHGEQRQLEIALALATRPSLLLLDEPMAGMGPDEASRMVELLERLRANVSILLVEHDMNAVFRLADRIAVLVYGRILLCDRPEIVRNDEEVRRAYLGDEAALIDEA